ncbi:hypothetical protein [Salmonirosea aquatica]|uniref:DUF4138 domain-containing protein n=1 Tax=Salmonirosea aquatica TaxID=2654236 RepID=A0A7C9FTD6_9BACT|nr:hypothetical protein [Cytophagaceae bacterium SJW1-29]
MFYATIKVAAFTAIFSALVASSATSQVYSEPSVYKGSVLRVSERVCAECSFYSALPIQADGKRQYVDSLGRIDNEYLFLKVFDVADVVEVKEASKTKVYLKLVSQSDSLTSYFQFYKDDGLKFPFEISKKTEGMKKVDICAFVEREVDKFTGEISLHYSRSRLFVEPVRYTKKGITSYYLHISTSSSQPTASVKGAILLMRNKQKINFPSAKVSTELNEDKYLFGNDSYVHSVFVPVTKQQMDYLSKNEVSDLRVYVFDKELTATQSFEIKTVMECFLKEK